MKPAIIIILSLILISCNREKKKEVFKLPEREDINSIVEAVIFDDTFGLAKENSRIPICNELKKVEFSEKDYYENRRSKFDSLSVSDLIDNPEFPVKNFFEKIDSSFIKFQLKKNKKVTLPSSVFRKLKTNSLNEELENGYFYLTVPILSSDLKRAYIQLTWMYNIASEGDEFFLEKENNRWKVIKKQFVWAR